MKGTGLKGLFLQPSTYGRNESGQYATWFYEGTAQEAAIFAAQLDHDGYLYEVRESFGKTQIYVRIERNPHAVEQPVSLWEYFNQKAEKDLLEASVPTGITATLSQKNIETIRSAVNGTFPAGATTLAEADFTDGNPANALTLYNHLQTGVRSTPTRAPLLRHTQTVSNNWAVPASLVNVGLVLSTATLSTFEGVPAGLLFNLPNLTLPAAFQNISLAYGWLKNEPTIQQIALRKWQIVQEWEYGLWPTSIFGSPL